MIMQTSALGREGIESFESCMQAVAGRPGFFSTYRDEAGVLTIGFGHTNLGGVPPKIAPGVVWTQDNCDQALTADLADTERTVEAVQAQWHFTLTQSQWDALVSFEFNTGHLRASSIPAKLADGNVDAAIATLLLYNHAGNPPHVLSGLTRRREYEAALFRGNLQLAASIADMHLQTNQAEQIETAAAVPAAVEASSQQQAAS
jgi:lysozyme